MPTHLIPQMPAHLLPAIHTAMAQEQPPNGLLADCVQDPLFQHRVYKLKTVPAKPLLRLPFHTPVSNGVVVLQQEPISWIFNTVLMQHHLQQVPGLITIPLILFLHQQHQPVQKMVMHQQTEL